MGNRKQYTSRYYTFYFSHVTAKGKYIAYRNFFLFTYNIWNWEQWNLGILDKNMHMLHAFNVLDSNYLYISDEVECITVT